MWISRIARTDALYDAAFAAGASDDVHRDLENPSVFEVTADSNFTREVGNNRMAR